MFPWDWLADLCAAQEIPCGLGHALSMKALHGGKATQDKIDSQKLAALLRGGLLPQADVSPAAMRATRDLLRRRTPLMRQRAALVAHGQNTNAQYKLPDIGKEIASKAHREGVAGRFPAGAVHKPIEVDLALRTYADALLSALALSILQTAKQHDAPPLSLRQTGPGIGKILRRVRRYALHDIDRVPRGQDVAADGRLVKGAQASAGKRWGTSGKKIGNAPRPWAFSEAAPLCLRTNPNGQKLLTRVAKTHGKGKALTILAHNLARAVYPLRTRHTACDMESCFRPSRSRAGEPAPHWPPTGGTCHPHAASPGGLRRSTRRCA